MKSGILYERKLREMYSKADELFVLSNKGCTQIRLASFLLVSRKRIVELFTLSSGEPINVFINRTYLKKEKKKWKRIRAWQIRALDED